MTKLFSNRKALRRAIILGALTALLTSSMVVYTTISATDLNPGGAGDEDIAIAVNTYVVDTEITIQDPDLKITFTTQTATGTTTPGDEPTSSFPEVRTALTADNYAHTFRVQEAGVADWLTSEDFRVRVYGHDASGPTTTQLGTLYIDQNTAEAGSVEGVQVTVDLGSSTVVYDNYDIIVDRQAETP